VASPKASLTYKIFFGTALVVAAVLGISLMLASRSANRAAEQTIQRGLEGTREQVQSLLAVRERAMTTGAGVFAQSAPFRAIVESRNTSDALDQSVEAVQQLEADWTQITDREGIRLAKSDEPGAPSDTLAASGLIGKALEGTRARGYGISQSGDTLFQAVAVPVLRSGNTGSVVGVLMAT
jgi:sensor histidine kinase regulating citrate/malate metabolism